MKAHVVTFEEEAPGVGYYQPMHVFTDIERAWGFAVSLYKERILKQEGKVWDSDSDLRESLSIEGFLQHVPSPKELKRANLKGSRSGVIIVRIDTIELN